MTKVVTVAMGYSQVPLPDGNIYNYGPRITLTDEQYAAIPSFILSQLVLISSTQDQPEPVLANDSYTAQVVLDILSPLLSALETNVSTGQAAALQKSSNLSDLVSAAIARTNLGLAPIAASGSATDITTGTLSQSRLPDLSGTYAPVAGAARNPLTGWFHPEGFGTVTYGKGVTQAQAQANAAAVQAAIDAANNSGGVAANTPGGGLVDIRDVIEVYTASAVSALTIYSGVHLVGHGIGGDVFSGTDANLPFRGSVLRLWSGANQDLIRTANFATLTGQSSPSAYATPSRFGFHNLVLDGNKAGNTTGIVLRIFGRAYDVDHVVIQNGAQGGAYSEYGAGGYEMEAHWANFAITDNNGDGLTWKGPHDSLFQNGTVARNDTFNGINIVAGSSVGGEQFANVHVWGSHVYQWILGGTNAGFLNCVSDGSGIQVLGSGNTWIGGAIYGSAVTGQLAITLGDGTTRTVAANVFRTRCFNYSKGSLFHRLTANTTSAGNVYQIAANLAGASRYTGGAGVSTLNGSVTFPATTIVVTSASSFPTGGGNLYISDGTTIATCAYTGVSGNTLTGVTGGAGTLPTGSAIFSLSASAAGDTWEILDPDNASAGGFFQTAQSTILTRVGLSNTSFNVGTQILRPNSSATAYQQMRNETGRVDLAWDNSSTFGKYSYQNGATVEGRLDTSTKTWAVDSAVGAVQPGTASGVGGRLFSGSGVPTISATSGDYYFRTDTPSTGSQRLYICTGTTNWIPVITPSPMEVNAAAMGFLWENYPRNGGGGSSALVSGTVYYSLFAAMPGKTLTGLAFDVITAGSGQTLVRAAVINPSTGAIVAQSNDVHTTFQSTGIQVASLTSSVTVTAPTSYYAALIGVGGTQPFLNRGNAGTDAQRYGSNAYSFGRLTGQTDITATGPNAGSGQALWVAGVGTSP